MQGERSAAGGCESQLRLSPPVSRVGSRKLVRSPRPPRVTERFLTMRRVLGCAPALRSRRDESPRLLNKIPSSSCLGKSRGEFPLECDNYALCLALSPQSRLVINAHSSNLFPSSGSFSSSRCCCCIVETPLKRMSNKPQ
jgi:hypothetical protein